MKKFIIKLIKKTFIILMISAMLFTAQMLSNTAKATIVEENTKVKLYSKGELICLVYDGIKIGTQFVVYEKEGKEYPAYCVNREKDGVTEDFSYSVIAEKIYSNNLVWNAVINGYPFKTPKELGCDTEIEAFTATKLAIYDMLYDYDMNKFNICADNGQRVLDAMKKIRSEARNSNKSKIIATVKIISEMENWEIDDIDHNYISKIYKVEASAINEEYKVNLTNNNIAKVVDEENKEKTTFASKEKFKIMIPIKQLENSGELTINVKSDLKTYPILYGKSTVENKQNYVLTVGEFETTSVTKQEKYVANKTKIKVNKQDGDTKLPLQNSKFNLLDGNKKIIYTELTTDEKGNLEVENLIPGTYYLQEIQAPKGYAPYKKLIEITVKLNETVEVTVENFKEPAEEEKEVPDDIIQIKVGEKNEMKKLPRTGF